MKAHFRIPFQRMLILCCVVLLAPAAALPSNPRLTAVGHMRVWGGSCERGIGKVIAGSPFFIQLKNTAEKHIAEPLLRGWPKEYVLEAALDLLDDADFVPTPGLIERLAPEAYLSVTNLMYEAWLGTSDSVYVDRAVLNKKHFVLHIPEDLAGHRITFRARYQGVGLSLLSNPVGPILIIAPCDIHDQSRIAAIRVYEAWHRKDDSRAVEIADSMLEHGLSDATGWAVARSAATSLELPHKSLAYLERQFEDFGVLAVKSGTANPPQFNPHGPRRAEDQQNYERFRSSLLESISRQQQR